MPSSADIVESEAAETATAEAPPSAWASRLTSIAVASALFMEFVDSTALSTALPTLARACGTDPIHLKLALTSYIVALAVFAPASGWIADRFGAKRVFMIAMTIFMAGSILCGFAHSLGELVAYRVIQGMGGAMMTPVGRLIIVGSAPRERLVAAMSWFTMPALVGPLVGPPIAGLILSVADWPWIFFVNAPVCLLGMAAVAALVPKLRQPHPGRFDFAGFVMSAVAISALVGATETIGLKIVPPAVQVAAALLAVGVGALYVRHALRIERPVLDLRLLRYATFRASLTGGTFVRLGIGAGPFLMPLLLQVGLGWSPFRAGMITIGQGLGAMSAKFFAPGLLRRFGFRTILTATVIGAAVMTAIPGFFRDWTPVWLIMALLVVAGFIRSNQFTAANTVAYADVPQDKVSAASTLATVAQQVGLSLGISFGGLMLHLAKGSEPERLLTPDRFTAPFIAVGVVTLLALPVYLRLPRSAGSGIGGRSASA